MNRKPEVEVITSIARLRQISGEWIELWRASEQATVFQSPYWLFAWWEHFSEQRLMCVITVREEGALTGIAPFYIEGGEARFIGQGISDYLDFVVSNANSEDIASTLLETVFRATDINKLTLESLPSNSPVIRASSRFASVAAAQDVCPVLTLDASAETNGRRAKEARKLRYYNRRLERAGQFSIEAADGRNFERYFDAFLRLHRERWSLRGEGGVLDNAGICAFHRKVARQLLNEGGLRLYLLTLEGREAAAFYGFRHKRRTMYYLGGFLPEFKQLNVGTIIVGYAIEQAAREGAPEFDFLRGDESYKYDWGAINRLTYRRTIYRDSKVCKAEAQARPILNRMMADNV
jgi:CelD/BcsL family acetyltransferase involved in cellulose biosynthesis